MSKHSGSDFDDFLRDEDTSVTLSTLDRASLAVGHHLRIELDGETMPRNTH